MPYGPDALPDHQWQHAERMAVTLHGLGWSADLAPILPVTLARVRGSLCLAGTRLSDLAARHGTPLYVYDQASLRSAAREALTAFRPLRARVGFAAKACALVGVLSSFRALGLDLDVVSAGEIEAALRAGFVPAQMHFHGNCKTD